VPRYDLRRRLLLLAARLLGTRPARLACPPVAERHRACVARALGGAARRAGFAPYPLAEALRAQVDRELAELGLPSGARPVALAPGAAWPAKIWPHFDALAPRLTDTGPLLLVGGPEDAPRCEALAAPGRAIAFCGDRPLPQVAAALARCRLLVTGDSGLGHLAEALGIPVLVLFGPTVPAFGFAPQGPGSRLLERELRCRPCSLHGERDCRYEHRNCLADLSAERVHEALRGMLSE
jgi:heptosyltransferase-2